MNLMETVPALSNLDAQKFVAQHYDLPVAKLGTLPGERDQNFLIQVADGREFVLKVSNAAECRSFLEAQNAVLQHLADRVDFAPVVHRAKSDEAIVEIESGAHRHLVRLVSFLPGQPMTKVGHASDALLADLGRKIAKLDLVLADFDHPGFHREFHWDLARATGVINERIELVDNPQLRQQIDSVVDRWNQYCQPLIKDLPRSVIHNDANDGNLIVAQSGGSPVFDQVAGIVDFGDAVLTWTINDLAIAIAYAVLDRPDPLATAVTILKGYHEVRPVTDVELECLYGLICMRLCTSAVIAADQIQSQPDNEYLTVSQRPIERTLPRLVGMSFPAAHAIFRQAVGHSALIEPNQSIRVKNWLLRHQADFVFPVNPRQRGIRPAETETLVVDLSVESPHLPTDVDRIQEPMITRIIDDLFQSSGAGVIVGRYLEPRLLYSSSHFVSSNLAEECRTVHLGIDLFAPAGTDVLAPLAGTVHYAGSINKALDYGGLILLRHEPEVGVEFFSLYGHLDPDSFLSLRAGDAIAAGQKIAELGQPVVNGGWTPHLHFQVMLDLLGMEHEFPGVAFHSQLSVWEEVSPDPNLILGIPSTCFPQANPSKQQTLNLRQRRVGPGLSLGYDEPIKLVRGWKQYLFDESGRRYLDAYNNVPHVGHCHPDVVDSVHQQMRLLNTNTRYLHDNVNKLAESITSTMPDGLDVCYVLNSASEANELAIRMARNFTGGRDMIVLEAAYHGHTSTLIDISPYKHNGPGGKGAPSWVHQVALANTFSGKYRDSETAAVDYANEVESAIGKIDQQLCAFIFESCPSVGGQIIFPPGYLDKACHHVRNAGGICIADDVQTGYGRLGSSFYGFELAGIVPDMVILGKPIGNGHPLAAVITRREIADAFNNGMEFFSTFGGNTVSSAAGLAVLDVLSKEDLPANAAKVGNGLLEALSDLQSDYSLIGDVRGQGFFLGMELVEDRGTLAPAASAAKHIANFCRMSGVLIGTDGPDHNVLKIRPPMCFDEANADQLLNTLSRAFRSLG